MLVQKVAHGKWPGLGRNGFGELEASGRADHPSEGDDSKHVRPGTTVMPTTPHS